MDIISQFVNSVYWGHKVPRKFETAEMISQLRLPVDWNP